MLQKADFTLFFFKDYLGVYYPLVKYIRLLIFIKHGAVQERSVVCFISEDYGYFEVLQKHSNAKVIHCSFSIHV
jgi:hypothetical protein